ncbi:MAG: YwiC-like family protein [Opitutaceae bacterium]|nr:YwiC-like family protein [Opitutaceae bacterium]
MDTAVQSLPSATAGFRPAASSVFLPKEHGSWSLALEPVLFGLLVAPSLAGGALAVSAAAAFFLRRPAKAVWRAPHRAAWLAVVILGICAVVGVGKAILLAGWSPLVFLLPALPLAALFLHWDRQNESRATHAELAACGIFALLPAVMAAQAGRPVAVAVTLSAIMLARSLPTVLIIRTYLRRRKGSPAGPTPAGLTTFVTVGMILALALTGHAPWTAVVLVLIAALRLGLLVPAWQPDWPAKRIGIAEAIFGLGYVLLIAAAFQW